MGKNDAKALGAGQAAAGQPALGSQVQVVVAEGAVLLNSETGRHFEAGVPTLQTVTLTTLRRLADGDLALA